MFYDVNNVFCNVWLSFRIVKTDVPLYLLNYYPFPKEMTEIMSSKERQIWKTTMCQHIENVLFIVYRLLIESH